jgi:hypothetical protein
MARSEIPPGIDRARHQDLTGRGLHVWGRRVALMVVAAIPLLGLLNVFGQRAAPVSYPGTAASLLVDAPARVRGGLIFTTEIAITPHQQLHDARLYLGDGWFEGMSLNGVEPQPSTESSRGGWQVWDYGRIATGVTFRIWISWQANPTNIGRHSQDIALYDGGTQLMIIHRALTVFP